MAELKREYIIPLRRKYLSAPKWRRSKKAIAVLKDFIQKHMKCEDVIVCAELNEHIWSRGSKYPPGKVEVIALKMQSSDGEKVLVNLKEHGIDAQKSMYAATQQQSSQESATDEVVDTQVEEKVEDETKASQEEATTQNKEDKKNG